MSITAEDLREQGDFLKALKQYKKEIVKFPDSVVPLLGRALTYKHLYLLKNNKRYIKLSFKDINHALNISRKKDKYKIYFAIAETYMLIKNYLEAVLHFQKAYTLYPINDAQKGRFLQHLGEAQYQSGNTKNGLKNLLAGLKLIHQYAVSTDSFLIHVWESGCLMKLAYFLRDKNYLKEAEKIVESDSRLIIRKRQLEELKKYFK